MALVRKIFRLSVFTLALFRLTPVSAANINVVWTSEVGQFAPLWVTKEAKLFEKYGNNVQLIFIQGAASAAAALTSGDAHVGMFSPQVGSDAAARARRVWPPGQHHGQPGLCAQRH